MAGWFPKFQVLIAFNNAVFDDPALITTIATPAGTLGALNVWTDVTPWVRDDVTTNRGKQNEVDRFQTGTMTCVFDNRDGRFDPWNTSSPYTGKIAPGRPVRLQATDPNTSTVTPLFTGVADSWTTVWDLPTRGNMSLSCVDWFSYLNQNYLISGLYPASVLADAPTAWYRLNEPAGTTSAPRDSSGNNNSSTYSHGTVGYGQPGALENSPVTGGLLGTSPATPTADFAVTGITSATFSIEGWYQLTTPSISSWFFGQYGDSTQTSYINLVAPSNGLLQINMKDAGGLILLQSAATSIPLDTLWHHMVFTRTAGALGILYIDGQVKTLTTVTNTTPVANTAYHPSVGSNGPGLGGGFTGNLQEFAIYNGTALSATRVLAHFNAGTADVVETSDARIKRICSWVGIPTANATTINVGKSLCQAETQALTSSSALSYLQQVEQTEDGCFFIDGSGQIRFLSRDTVYTTLTSVATFGDNVSGGEFPIELNPTIPLDTINQYAQVSLTRNNGNSQVVPQIPPAGQTYQQSGLLQTTDAEVLGEANWTLNQFNIPPKPRLRTITVHPQVTPTGTATTAILGLELMAVATVNRHTVPGAGTAFSQVCNVTGINHHVNAATFDWTVDLELTPLPPTRPWILGTSTLGVDTNLFF